MSDAATQPRAAGARVTIALLAISSILTLVPLAWMVLSSLKSDAEINTIPPTIFPQEPTLDQYALLFEQFNFAVLTVNSIIVTVTVVVGSVVLGGLAAYGFSRFPFTGSRALLILILLTRMITPAALVVPMYLMMEALNLTNTLISVCLGIVVLNLPFVIWILKPFFDSLPRDAEEAAQLDGLSTIGVWRRVVLPMSRPGIATVALFSFIVAWTDLLVPLTMSTRADGWTLPAGILQMQTGFKIYWGALMAGGIYMTLPALVIAFALQRYLARGLRAGY